MGDLDPERFEHMWNFSTGCCSGRYQEILMREMNEETDETLDSQRL